MTEDHNSNTPQHFANALRARFSSELFLLLTLFTILYIPFFLEYGWGFRDTPALDLPTFYSASVVVFDQGGSPYDLTNLRSLMGPETIVPPYLYPPPSLLLIQPLSYLTYPDARKVVLALNHLLYVSLVWVIPVFLLRLRPRDGIAVIAICLVYSLTFFPAVFTLRIGQVNILLLVFLILFWILARKGKTVLGGFFLAIAILLKTYPLVIIPLLLLIGRRRDAAYTVAWLALAVLVSFLILPGAIWEEWLVNVLPSGGYTRIPHGLWSPAAIWNQSLNGFFSRMLTLNEFSSPWWVNPGLARVLTYGVAGVIAIATGLAAWRSSQIHKDSLDRTLMAALPAIYLIAPLSWKHHVVYLLPSMLMLISSSYSSKLIPMVVYYFLSIGSIVLLGMSFLSRFNMYGVVVLWLLCVFVACSTKVKLVSGVDPSVR